ncbi:MAG: cytochrome P450 [Reyranellaceae bacterium]
MSSTTRVERPRPLQAERPPTLPVAPQGAPATGSHAVAEAVQSNVIRSVNPQTARYVFFQVADPEAFRRFLGHLLDPQAGASDDDNDFLGLPPDLRKLWSEGWAHDYDEYNNRSAKPLTWNIAFTWTGLQALGIDANTLASFPEDFRDGMAARAARLGDTGDSAPENWEGWLGHRAVHGMLQISVQQDAQQIAGIAPGRVIVEFLVRAFSVFGLRILHTENGERIAAPWDSSLRIEHFGFRDGISQPFADVELGTPRPPPSGGGTPRPGGTWDPIALGELLLGHPDEDGLMQQRPANADLRQNGTYLVFRKLEQDVPGFRRYLREQSGKDGPDSLLAAQMMGRWPDGTSLVKAAGWPIGARDERKINDFRYGEDPRGLRCPLGAHARRSNPRDSNDRDEARRHRIWRRSLTYGGDFLPYDSPGDGRPRGLLFVSLCARIDQQFEFLQTRWLNSGEFIGQAGLGRCPITGANGGAVGDSFAVAGRPAPYCRQPRFVTVRGGDYFFVPSLPALAGNARGDRFESPAESPAVNPSLDSTPKPIETEKLVQLAIRALLPPGAPAFKLVNGVALVGRQKYVRRVLDDDKTWGLAAMDRRMRQICGGEPLMLGLPSDDPDRLIRLRMWRDAGQLYRGPSWADIARGTMRAVLARHAANGRLDVLRHVSLVLPSALARAYFGVSGPDWISPTYIASLFAKLEIGQVPRDWLATLPHVAPQDVPITTLQFWAQTAFAHVFTNVINAAELTALAQRATAEFFRHLDALVAQAATNPSNTTLLGCLMSLDPKTYGLGAERFAVVVRLLLAELIVGSSGTLSQALPDFLDSIAGHPGAVDPAQRLTDDELDALIREALRFQPVAPVLFRHATRDAVLGGLTVPAGTPVAVLLKTAMADPRIFPTPDIFSTDPAIRPADGYLVFGAGLHACRGADIATVLLRESVRALLTLKDLHGAAGPDASHRDPLNRWSRYLVRFQPAAL